MMELVYIQHSKCWFCGFESHFAYQINSIGIYRRNMLMDKDAWIKNQIRNYGSFKSFVIVYGIIVGVFVGTALTLV